MARPKKTEPRDRQLNVSLTGKEYESLARRAQAIEMRLGHFGRVLLLDQSTRNPKRAEIGTLTRLYYNQLVRIGNNLNQMVRHLHQTGDPLPADLEPLLSDIRQVIARGIADDC